MLQQSLIGPAGTRPSRGLAVTCRLGRLVRTARFFASTRWLFGEDPAVQVIDLKVVKQDTLLHGLTDDPNDAVKRNQVPLPLIPRVGVPQSVC